VILVRLCSRSLALVSPRILLVALATLLLPWSARAQQQIPQDLLRVSPDMASTLAAMSDELRNDVVNTWNQVGADEQKRYRIVEVIKAWMAEQPPDWMRYATYGGGAVGAAGLASRLPLLSRIRFLGMFANPWVAVPAGVAAIGGGGYMYYRGYQASNTLKEALSQIRGNAPASVNPSGTPAQPANPATPTTASTPDSPPTGTSVGSAAAGDGTSYGGEGSGNSIVQRMAISGDYLNGEGNDPTEGHDATEGIYAGGTEALPGGANPSLEQLIPGIGQVLDSASPAVVDAVLQQWEVVKNDPNARTIFASTLRDYVQTHEGLDEGVIDYLAASTPAPGGAGDLATGPASPNKGGGPAANQPEGEINLLGVQGM
jgi:hypothetical protein